MLDRYTHHTKQTIINVYTQVDYTFRLHTDHTPIHNTVIDQTTFHSHTTLSSDRGFPGIHIPSGYESPLTALPSYTINILLSIWNIDQPSQGTWELILKVARRVRRYPANRVIERGGIRARFGGVRLFLLARSGIS